MRFRAVVRMVLILLPLTTTATRLHAHRCEAPDLATQEVNRCLNLVKIAASRRQTGRGTAADASWRRTPQISASGSTPRGAV
jgi:hypothetical protein